MISRDWQCMNERCLHVYHSFEKANPDCPKCGCSRVNWIPGGGHIAKRSPGYDRTLNFLADKYGMTNLNSPSPSRLNRAAPHVQQPAASWEQPVNFMPGFSSKVSANGATCGPSEVPMHIAGKIAITPGIGGQALPRSGSIPGPAANTVIAGRTTKRTIG